MQTANIKGIVSLTSWKARIRGVDKTIFSILKACPGFKVALTLSEEEFPKKEAELPHSLRMMAEHDIIDLIWCFKNYKPYKKIIFAMEKYPELPIISADDDCLYKYNYAEELYNRWGGNRKCIVSETMSDGIPFGYATLHPPMAYDTGYLKRIADYCLPRHSYHDDLMYTMYARRHGIDIVSLWHTLPQVVKFHNGAGGLIAERYKHHNDVAVMNEAFRVVT